MISSYAPFTEKLKFWNLNPEIENEIYSHIDKHEDEIKEMSRLERDCELAKEQVYFARSLLEMIENEMKKDFRYKETKELVRAIRFHIEDSSFER